MTLRSILLAPVLVVLLVAAVGGGPAHGQAPAAKPALPPAAVSAPTASPLTASPLIASPAELEALARTLEDPAARAKLIEQLRTLSAAQQRADPMASPAGLVERVLSSISNGIATVAGDVASAALSVKNLPRVTAWLGDQLREPALLEHWAVLFVKLASVLLAALLADRLV